MSSIQRILSNLIESMLIVLMIITPLFFFFLFPDPFEFSKMTLVYFLTPLIFLCFFINILITKKISIPKNFIFYSAFFVLLIIFFSYIFSIHKASSLFGNVDRFNGGLLSTLVYFVIFFITTTEIKENSVRKILIISGFSTGIVVALYAIAQKFGMDFVKWDPPLFGRSISTLGQPNFAGAYLAVTFTLGLAAFFLLKKIIFRIFITIGLVAIFLGLLSTQSRAGLLGLGLALIFLLAILIKYYAKFIKTNVVYIVILILIFLIIGFLQRVSLVNRIVSIKKETQTIIQIQKSSLGQMKVFPGTATSRFLVWQGAWQIAKHHPFLGTGPETLGFIFPQYKDPKLNFFGNDWNFRWDKAHNFIFDIMANTGFLGLGSWLILIFAVFWISFKKLNKLDYDSWVLVIICLGSLIAIIGSNLFSFSTVTLDLYFWVILGILLGTLLQSKDIFDIKIPKLVANIIFFFGFLLIVFLYFFWLKISISQVYFGRGNFSYSNQDSQRAIEQFQKTIKSYDSFDIYHGSLAMAYLSASSETEEFKLELRQKALQEADIAVDLNNYNSENWQILAKIQQATNDIDDAKKSWEKTMELDTANPDVHTLAASFYYSIDQKQKALDLVNQALILKHDFVPAIELKSKIKSQNAK